MEGNVLVEVVAVTFFFPAEGFGFYMTARGTRVVPAHPVPNSARPPPGSPPPHTPSAPSVHHSVSVASKWTIQHCCSCAKHQHQREKRHVVPVLALWCSNSSSFLRLTIWEALVQRYDCIERSMRTDVENEWKDERMSFHILSGLLHCSHNMYLC